MSLPSYEEFRLALADPARRSQIGLVIADSDAQSLAGNEEWAKNYYDSWIALATPAAPPAPAPAADPFASPAPSFGAPPAVPTEQTGYPAAPAAGGYAPAGYAAQSPQNGYQNTGSSLPQGQPGKKGLPGWALAVIIGGGVLVLAIILAVALIVPNLLGGNDDSSSASSNSQSEDESDSSAEPEDEVVPEDETDGLPDDLGGDYVPSYSDADAAAFTAAVAPVFGLEESEYVDTEMIQSIVIGAGESICVAIAAGYSEEELSEPMVTADLTAEDVQVLMDASREYLCP